MGDFKLTITCDLLSMGTVVLQIRHWCNSTSNFNTQNRFG